MKLNYYLRGLGIGIMVTALLMGISTKSEKMTDAQIKARAAELGMVDESDKVLADAFEQENDNSESKEKENTASSSKADTEVKAEAKADNNADNNADAKADAKTDAKTDAKSDAKTDAKSDAKADVKEDEKKTEPSDSTETVQSPVDVDDIGTKLEADDDGQAPKDDSKATNDDGKSQKDDSKATNDDGKSPKDDSKVPEIKAFNGTTVTLNISSGQSSTAVAKACQEAGLVPDASAFDKFLCENGYDRKITTGNKVFPMGASQVEIAGILTVR